MATKFLDAKWFSKTDWLRTQPQVRTEDQCIGSDAIVRIESICCERINEISKDEIRLLGFWSTADGEISGIMQQSFNFKWKNESQLVDLAIQLDSLAEKNVFANAVRGRLAAFGFS